MFRQEPAFVWLDSVRCFISAIFELEPVPATSLHGVQHDHSCPFCFSFHTRSSTAVVYDLSDVEGSNSDAHSLLYWCLGRTRAVRSRSAVCYDTELFWRKLVSQLILK
jgi:hypothetical protein